MVQYCRYCNNLVTGNGIYCTEKNKIIAENTAKPQIIVNYSFLIAWMLFMKIWMVINLKSHPNFQVMIALDK